jgi:hypothetical protein
MIPGAQPKLRFTNRGLSKESAVALRAIGKKYCPTCKTVKLVDDFFSNRSRRDGRNDECVDCDATRNAKYYAANTGKVLAYNASIMGVARFLRGNHHLDKPTSIKWATILCNDDTRCEICGIPCRILVKQGFWLFGGERMNRRLTLDHLTPGDNSGGLRPLCFSCNKLRGHAQFTDGEVLRRIRKWYRETRALRFLWWLNSRVVDGVCVGGREHRNKFMEKKILRLTLKEDSDAGSYGSRTG